MNNKIATRYLGTCPVCFQQCKLRNGVMVHHGFQRPGYGYIVGDCMGVGHVPFEVSCRQTEHMIEHLHKVIDGLMRRREKAENGDLGTHILYATNTGLNEVVVGVSSKSALHHAFETIIVNCTNNIYRSQLMMNELKDRLAGWKPQDITTFEEVMEARKRATQAERAAKQAERAQKAEEKRARKEALEARRDEAVAELASRITTLAATAENAAELDKLMYALRHGKKYGWLNFDLFDNLMGKVAHLIPQYIQKAEHRDTYFWK